MTISLSLYAEIAAEASVTSLLASADAIFPARLPQNHAAFPAMTYQLEDDEDIGLLQGGVSDLHFANLEVYIYARDAVAPGAIAAALKTFLIGKFGVFGSNHAERIDKTSELSDFETATELHFVRLVFRISYR